jgi:DNA-binding MarR family transcriptional regulator
MVARVGGRQAPPRSRSLLLDAWAAAQQVNQLILRELAAVGVRTPHFAMLSAIGNAGRVTPTGLAAELGHPLTTISDHVQVLLDRGLVDREPNPGDRRSYLLSLTPKGKTVIRQAHPAVQRTLELIEQELEFEPDEIADAVAELKRATQAALTR